MLGRLWRVQEKKPSFCLLSMSSATIVQFSPQHRVASLVVGQRSVWFVRDVLPVLAWYAGAGTAIIVVER